MERRRMAIVGAGPAGLVAALAARQAGLDVELFEQAPDFKRVGAGLFLHSNGLRVLDTLGLLPSLAPLMQSSHIFSGEVPGAGRVSYFDYRLMNVPHNHGGVVLRADLQELLLAAVLRAGVPVRFDHKCSSATLDGDHAVLRFANGREHEFDAVIASDGIHSEVRRSMGFKAAEHLIGSAYLRGIAPIRPRDATSRELWGKDGRSFGLLPLTGDRTYWYCSVEKGRWPEILKGRLEAWIESWSSFGPEVMKVMRSVEDWSRVRYDEILDVRLKHWVKGPVFVVGDAAHAMTPNIGQGANAAMVDALVLIRLMADDPGASHAGVGRRYEAIRRRFVHRTQAMSLRMDRVASWSSPPARAFRNFLFRLGEKAKFLSRPYDSLLVGHNPEEEFAFSPPGKK